MFYREIIEELTQAVEGVINMLTGMRFDQRIPKDAQNAMIYKANDLQELINKIERDENPKPPGDE